MVNKKLTTEKRLINTNRSCVYLSLRVSLLTFIVVSLILIYTVLKADLDLKSEPCVH